MTRKQPTSTVVIDLTEELPNSASNQFQAIHILQPESGSRTNVTANTATKTDYPTIADLPGQRSPVPLQPLVNVAGNVLLPRTKYVE